MMPAHQSKNLKLQDGSNVAVIGGGPAGSFFAWFILRYARESGINIHVDIFEPKDFNSPGPSGCNKCGGIVSESLVGIEHPFAMYRNSIYRKRP